jgi:hypothetical protein
MMNGWEIMDCFKRRFYFWQKLLHVLKNETVFSQKIEMNLNILEYLHLANPKILKILF